MSDTVKIGGIWLPPNEKHLTNVLEQTASRSGKRGTYQIATLGAMMNYIPPDSRKTVLDIGGHVGLWSMHLCRYFQKVIAFEPVPILQRCFEQNINNPDYPAISNVDLRKYGLGEENTEIQISFELENSGHTHVQPTDPSKWIEGAQLVDVQIKRLDDEEFESVNAIKIDVEGYELAVLKGAEQTIRKHKPVVCLEQKPHGFYEWGQYDAAKLLTSWGARPTQRIIDDYIFTW